MSPQRPAVVLIGPPGAQAADAGRSLGALLGLPVLDTDVQVAEAAGRPVPDIFVEQGEPVFRSLERAAVVEGLAGHGGILVLGSGAVSDPRTEADLAGHTVVFLDVEITDAAKRLGFNRERPVAIGNPRAQWLKQMEQRRPVYRRLATAMVRTDGLTPDEIAREVAQVLR